MRTTQEVYDHYRIPPWLQEHQLRVAAVGKTVCGIRPEADERTVTLVGLFHDMGNILKFDLAPDGPLASLMDKKGVVYWQQVKDDFARTYGKDEHVATLAIARELQLSDEAIALMDGISFSKMERIRNEGPLELQICEYADMRVGPFGILPMRERVADLKKCNVSRWAQGLAKDMERTFESSAVLLDEIEEELFKGAILRPQDIADASIAPLIDELHEYEIV